MQSFMLVALLAALSLNVALALPVNLGDVEETLETDEQLLKLLGGQSMEATSSENSRLRRMSTPFHTIDAHEDELAHELRNSRRKSRAAGEEPAATADKVNKVDSSASSEEMKATVLAIDASSSEEKPQPQPRKRQAGEDSSSSSEEDGQTKQLQKPDPQPQLEAGQEEHEAPAKAVRRRRAASEDSSASSEEDGQTKQLQKPDTQPQLEAGQEEHEEPAKAARRRRAASEDSSASSEEDNKLKQQQKPDTQPQQEAEPAAAARHKRSVPQTVEGESLKLELSESEELMDPLNMEDYAQGCEVLEINSDEANNETAYVA